MSRPTANPSDRASASHWLRSYYFVRAGVALAWVAGAFTIGQAMPLVGAAYASRAGFGRVRAWVLAHAGAAKRVMGALLVLVGVLILSGGDHAIEAWVNDHLPDAWLALTTRL